MRKLNYFVFVIGAIFALQMGCSPKNIEVREAEDYNQTLKAAWNSYDNMDFEGAINGFQRVISHDVSLSEAFLGLGWTYGQLGNVQECISNLNLAITANTNTPPLVPVFRWHPPTSSISVVHPPFDTTLTLVEVSIPQEYRPFVGLMNFKIIGDLRNWKLYYFTDSTFAMKPEYLDTSEVPALFDSLYVDFLRVDNTLDVNDEVLSAYVGLASAYSAQEDYLNSIAVALTVNRLSPQYQFNHYPQTTMRELLINLASDYLAYGLNMNAVWLLQELDSTWTYDYTTINPYSLMGVEEILKEIMKLKGLN